MLISHFPSTTNATLTDLTGLINAYKTLSISSSSSPIDTWTILKSVIPFTANSRTPAAILFGERDSC